MNSDLPSDLVPVANRIKRAQGQLAGVLRMLEDGRDSDELLTQLRAVGRALDRAGLALVAAQLRSTLGEDASLSAEELAAFEKLLLSVA